MAITVVFFLWPAGHTAWQSVLREDPFGLKTTFIWFDNYARLFKAPNYLSSFGATGLFAFATAEVSIGDALILVVLAASWKQVSYNFLFFVAGLQSIPLSLKEAAAIDGAGPLKRFWTIVFPLLSPTTFFLLD